MQHASYFELGHGLYQVSSRYRRRQRRTTENHLRGTHSASILQELAKRYENMNGGKEQSLLRYYAGSLASAASLLPTVSVLKFIGDLRSRQRAALCSRHEGKQQQQHKRQTNKAGRVFTSEPCVSYVHHW
jgi:hypothetical protein